MTKFLSADGIRDDLRDLSEALEGLAQLSRQRRSAGGLTGEESERMDELVVVANRHLRSLSGLLDAFPCAPLIYTGDGNTEDVINTLERLLAAGVSR